MCIRICLAILSIEAKQCNNGRSFAEFLYCNVVYMDEHEILRMNNEFGLVRCSEQ